MVGQPRTYITQRGKGGLWGPAHHRIETAMTVEAPCPPKTSQVCCVSCAHAPVFVRIPHHARVPLRHSLLHVKAHEHGKLLLS